MVILEYIWLDAKNNYRSKTKVISESNGADFAGFLAWKKEKKKPSNLPLWNYDGSSTGQAIGIDSEVYIRPVYIVEDPFRRNFPDRHSQQYLVLCDTWLPNGKPHPDNTRQQALKLFDTQEVKDAEPWFGIEQEFFITKPLELEALGMQMHNKSTGGQGQYYCSVGTNNCYGRKYMEEALENMLYANLNITGMNFEVACGQCEFQVMNEGILAADQLHLLRYILIRTLEKHDLLLNLHPKPYKTHWNGSGCHVNYSTKNMREDGGILDINDAIKKLKIKHLEHIEVYGKDNNLRLTGDCETADINTFSSGVADRGSSIRIPRFTDRDGKGYLEDRRPASNMDPYLVTSKLVETTIL